MPRKGPVRPGITFRAAPDELAEIDRFTEATSERLGRKVPRTKIMRARNWYAARSMPQTALDRWLAEHPGES